VSDDLIAVAEGPEGLFATLTARGVVSVWSSPEDLLSRFVSPIGSVTVPGTSHRLAIVVDGDEVDVVVGSWTEGLAAYTVDGALRWHRHDMRHVQRLRALPTDGGAKTVAGVVLERGGGLVLGRTGGTRHRIPEARFMAGWSDGSLLVFDGKGVSRRAAPDAELAWRVELATFALLDAALDGGATVCGADGRLTHIDQNGVVAWRTPALPNQQIVRVRADPEGDGWICLATTTDRRIPPQVLRVASGGEMTPVVEVPGSSIDFVGRGSYLVARNGNVMPVRRSSS
jgi:hypothetical protein